MEGLPNELYRRWETVRSEAASGAWGLWDLKSGSRWTFGEIQAEVETRPPLKRGSLRCPSGFSVELIFETLRAWRDGAVLCPVERDGDAPGEEAIAGLAPEICHLKLTSGTSSGPRMVAFDPGPLAADARKIVSTMGLRREWPNLGIISMSHSYGFSNLVLPLVLHGIPLAWLGDPLPGAVANVLENKELRLDGWTLPAVPAMWRVWHESRAIPRGAIRLAITAGAPMPVDLERDLFASTGLKIHNFYGSSECGGIAYDRTELPRTDAELVGTAMDDTVLSVTEEGCLSVESPSVGTGYWENGAMIYDRLGGGVFQTSDLAILSALAGENDAVRLTGRRDDLINVAGRKVSPARVEAALSKVPGVQCAVVFGIPSEDSVRGDEVVAIVNWADGSDESSRFLEAWKGHGEGLAAHERPRHWWFCDELCPDLRGKLSRHAWRQRYLDRSAD